MNIISVSGCQAKNRNFAQQNRQRSSMLLSVLLLAISVLHYALLFQAPGEPGSRLEMSLFQVPRTGQQQQPGQFLQNSLDSVAAQIMQMQWWAGRDETPGGRLMRLGGRNPGWFRHSGLSEPLEPPFASARPDRVRVGAGALTDGQRVTRLTHREALLQNQLGRELLPPVSPINESWPATGFGLREDPFTGAGAMHEGIDYMAPPGTSICALADGVVVYSENHYQYGNMLEIYHGNSIVTRYAHASRLLVRVGQVVWRGEKIAEVGSTGRATGSHLHFEVRHKGIAQNPVRFLQNAAS